VDVITADVITTEREVTVEDTGQPLAQDDPINCQRTTVKVPPLHSFQLPGLQHPAQQSDVACTAVTDSSRIRLDATPARAALAAEQVVVAVVGAVVEADEVDPAAMGIRAEGHGLVDRAQLRAAPVITVRCA